jgi:hypothetical protein
MKISSQLANNFDYCSAEDLLIMISSFDFLCALSASAVSHTEACRLSIMNTLQM